jgi:uncharacterized membrane protein YsdA (DUF1294 family)
VIWPVIACIYALISLVTFIVYGFDKHRARCGGWRVPEPHLHGLELLGGWPGAIFGQMLFRHKLRKTGYMLVFVGIVALHVTAWALWYWRFRTA